MSGSENDFIVMTSGGFTAAHLNLVPQLQKLLRREIVTATTSVGLGDSSIESRLKRGERAELVIVSSTMLEAFERTGLTLPDSATPLGFSTIGLAVRAGAPPPDISSVEALKNTLLTAESVAYSASVSGKYLTTELYQQLGIADEMLPKSKFAGGGVRTGTVVARGDAELAVQQISELIPIEGIDHITPLPAEVQRTTTIAAGIGGTAKAVDLARKALEFLTSPDAYAAIEQSGLTPAGKR